MHPLTRHHPMVCHNRIAGQARFSLKEGTTRLRWLCCVWILVVAAGCGPTSSRPFRVQATAGFEAVYEGEFADRSSWEGSSGIENRYALTLVNLITEKTDTGYKVASLRCLRERRAPSPVPGGAAAPANEEYYLLTMPLRADLTRDFPRAAFTTVPALNSKLDDWFFPPLLAAALAPGSEWQWQERVAIPTFHVDDCRTKYRVVAQEKVEGRDTTVVESTVANKLPFKPVTPMPGQLASDTLTEYSLKHWIGDREPWLIKYEKKGHIEKPAPSKFAYQMNLAFALKSARSLTGTELAARREQVNELAELQDLALGSLYVPTSAEQLGQALERARKLESNSDRELGGLLKPAAGVLATMLEQKRNLAQAEKAKSSSRQRDPSGPFGQPGAASAKSAPGKGKSR